MSISVKESQFKHQNKAVYSQGSVAAILSLSFKFFWTQTKQKQNLIQLLTLGLLFFYLSFVTLLGNGAQQYLNNNLQQLLGADSVIQSYRPLPEEDIAELKHTTQKLSQVQTYSMTLTHQSDGKPLAQLIHLKVVDDAYPVHGQVQMSETQSLYSKGVSVGPNKGEIWLEPRLASALNLQLGERLTLGQTPLLFTALLLGEPDRLIEGHSSDMRAMVNAQSITHLVTAQELEAKSYRYLFAHSHAQFNQLQALANQFADATFTSKTLGNHPLAGIWLRVEKFMGLVTVLMMVIASITLFLSNKSVMAPVCRFCAVSLANGMRRAHSKYVALAGVIFTLCITLVPSIILALVCQYLVMLGANSLDIDVVFSIQWAGVFKAVILASLIFVSLTLPAWFKVINTPTRSLLMSYSAPSRLQLLVNTSPVFALIGLVIWYSDNWTLTSLILGTLAACLCLLIFLTWLVLGLGKRGLQSRAQLFGFAIYLMQQRIFVKGAQIIALGLSLTLILLCLRITQDVTDVLDKISYRDQGNTVITQVDSEQLNALDAFVQQYNSQLGEMYAYQYAQLTKLNGVNLKDAGLQPSDTLRRMARPIRLHWQAEVPTNNALSEGSWAYTEINDSGIWPVSIEREVFDELNLQIGDLLTMQLGEHSTQLKVASVHDFVSGGSTVTFWFVRHGAKPILGPKVWFMGDADLSDEALKNLGQLWQQYPTMRLLSVESLLSQTRLYLNAFVTLVLIYSTFIALLSNLLMAAAIQVHLQQDKKRNGLLSAFGLNKSQQIRLACYEWGIITVLPAIAATSCVYFSMQAFYDYELKLPYEANFFILAFEAVLVALLIALSGIWMSKGQLKTTPRDLLNDT